MVKLTQNSWLGGQMDARMTGRQDMKNYRNGASVLKNFVPVKLGSIRKRPGTDLVCDLTDFIYDSRRDPASTKFRMIPFGFLSGEGLALVIASDAGGNCDARAYRFGVDGNGRHYVPVNGTVPYKADELDQIGYVQCGDIVYLAHKKHPPAEIRHIEDGSFSYSAVNFNPNTTKPTIGDISMTRQYFQDFTFSESDQATLDNCKNRGNFVDPTDPWKLLYYKTYDDESKRQYSGTTTVNYRASIMADGSEGPLSDVKALTFTSPWTESQIVKIPVTATIPTGAKKWQVRLYKENGGVYGLVGTSDKPNADYEFEYSENLEYIGKYSSLWYKYAIVTDDVVGSQKNPKSQRRIRVEDGETGEKTYKINVTVREAFSDYGHDVKIRLYQRNEDGEYVQYGQDVPVNFNTVSVVFVDDNIAPDTSETPIDDSYGVPFSKARDYPGSVGLYQQRLVWAGTEDDPARIWMSRAGDLYEYRPHDKLQLDDAIDFILPITQFANINFIVELGRLFAFTECTELVIGSNSNSAGVSYETIMSSEHSHLGCTKRLPPIVANNTLLFVNRTGQSVRDYDEKLGSTRFGGTDVSVFATSVFADNPIVDWTWQQEPNSTVWCVLADGRLASFTYDKEQEIMAWAVHELGGGGKARGIAKTCAVFGREQGRPTTGEVMVAVERDVGGWHGITLERMRPWADGPAGSGLSYCVDMMKLVNKGESIAGLPWASLTYMDADVVKTAGEAEREGWFTHTPGVSVIANRSFFVFFPFESVMTTMPPVIGDQVGQAQFDVKLGQHAHLRTINSRGGEIYAVGMGDQKSNVDGGAVRDGEDGAAFKDVDIVLAGSNNRDGRVTVRHDEPGPFQLALLELDYEAEN